MAIKKEQDTSSDIIPEASSAAETEATTEVATSNAADIQYTPLKTFADHNALKYGVELMGGFYHEQELTKRYADTEENWHILMDEFMNREVK
jgi:hypothetical protein